MAEPTDARLWILEPWTGDQPWKSYDQPAHVPREGATRLQVIAALIHMNGGFAIHGYGVHATGDAYGRIGLGHDEAFTLLAVGEYLRGLCDGHGGDLQAEVGRLIKAEINRVTALFLSPPALVVPA